MRARSIFHLLSPHERQAARRPAWKRYLLAAASVALAGVLTWLLDDAFLHRLPFLMFYPAVVASATYGGLGPGLLCSAISLVVADFWLEPLGSPDLHGDPIDVLAMAVFGGTLVLITLLSESLHRSRNRATSVAVALEERSRELEDRTQELSRSNAELEQFASVLAHDVRTPLLSLSIWTQLLRKALDRNEAPEIEKTLTNIQASARQLGEFIEHLLDYSRAGRGELRPALCDMEQVLQEVLRRTSEMLEAAGAKVAHDPLPKLQADCTLMGQLLQNLIENAVKYRGEAPPIVHVSATREGNDWVFSVADNGIGVPPEHAERIFHAFHRAHAGESRYSGLGIGLATCSRIIARHGGRIWVESQPGEGSTFFFSIPSSLSVGKH